MYYSADFMVKFGPTIPYPLYCIKKIYLNIWLRFQKFKFKNANIGMIPVADIEQKIDMDHLMNFNRVKDIVCIK
jgi:hypothetical protein